MLGQFRREVVVQDRTDPQRAAQRGRDKRTKNLHHISMKRRMQAFQNCAAILREGNRGNKVAGDLGERRPSLRRGGEVIDLGCRERPCEKRAQFGAGECQILCRHLPHQAADAEARQRQLRLPAEGGGDPEIIRRRQKQLCQQVHHLRRFRPVRLVEEKDRAARPAADMRQKRLERSIRIRAVHPERHRQVGAQFGRVAVGSLKGKPAAMIDTAGEDIGGGGRRCAYLLVTRLQGGRLAEAGRGMDLRDLACQPLPYAGKHEGPVYRGEKHSRRTKAGLDGFVRPAFEDRHIGSASVLLRHPETSSISAYPTFPRLQMSAGPGIHPPSGV